jgi:hypothetical protein
MNTFTTTVRAQVAEAEFFQNIKHLFSGSMVFIGEAMQNARRAGATKVEFEYDSSLNSLSIKDNGAGILDFGDLLKFSKSGWDKRLADAERPFGMGIFSLFHMAKTVHFHSRGQALSVSIADVVESKELEVQQDQRVMDGTVIVLEGLSISDCKIDPEEFLLSSVKSMAIGFPISVSLNGVDIDRPLSMSALQASSAVYKTPIGSVVVGENFPARYGAKFKLFLQGLPVGPLGDGDIIVHLDSGAFCAVMPDRQRLYDHKKALEKIQAAVDEALRQHLRFLRSEIPEERFVNEYWGMARRIGGVDDLLNSCGCLPLQLFSRTIEVSADSMDATETPFGGRVVTKKEFEDGEFKAWFDGPSYSTEFLLAPALMSVAIKETIYSIASSQVPEGHWLEELAPRMEDLSVEWDIISPGMGLSVETHHSYVDAVLCEKVKLRFRSSKYVSFDVACTIAESPVLLPTQKADMQHMLSEELLEDGITVYVPRRATETPEKAFGDFRNEYEQYMQEWADAQENQWADAYATLMGEDNLHRAVDAALSRSTVSFQLNHDLVMVRSACHWNNFTASRNPAVLEAIEVGDELLQRMAKKLQDGVTFESLKRVFQEEFQPGILHMQDEFSVLAGAAKLYLRLKGDVWVLHNALDAEIELDTSSQSPQEAAVVAIHAIAANAIGMSAEMFSGLRLDERAQHVSSAMTAGK